MPLRVCVFMSLGAFLLAAVACVLVGSGVGAPNGGGRMSLRGVRFPFSCTCLHTKEAPCVVRRSACQLNCGEMF